MNGWSVDTCFVDKAAMPIEPKMRSCVIVGHDINISILKAPWLVNQGILREAEISNGDAVFTSACVQINAEAFEFLALPDRIQMRLKEDSPDAQANLLRVLGGIATTLPHTPFTAIGLNFEFLLRPDGDIAFEVWNRSRFSAPSSLDATGDMDTVRFGAYYSLDALAMRVRVNMRPVREFGTKGSEEPERESQDETMLAHFNFNHDLVPAASAPDILQVLGKWVDAATYAAEIAAMECKTTAKDGPAC